MKISHWKKVVLTAVTSVIALPFASLSAEGCYDSWQPPYCYQGVKGYSFGIGLGLLGGLIGGYAVNNRHGSSGARGKNGHDGDGFLVNCKTSMRIELTNLICKHECVAFAWKLVGPNNAIMASGNENASGSGCTTTIYEMKAHEPKYEGQYHFIINITEDSFCETALARVTLFAGDREEIFLPLTPEKSWYVNWTPWESYAYLTPES